MWYHLTISSSAALFSFCLQSFPESGSFPVSWLFTSGDQNIGASASASVLPMNIQGWFPLGLTGLISFQSKRLSRVFSSTTVWKYQFLGIQPSLWSSSHIRSDYWENHSFDYTDLSSPCATTRLWSMKEEFELTLNTIRDFPGGPVVKTLCFHCSGCGFDPRLGN